MLINMQGKSQGTQSDNRVVAFLDILGFRNLVQSASGGDDGLMESLNKVLRDFSFFEQTISEDFRAAMLPEFPLPKKGFTETESGIRATVFSDNIVISAHCTSMGAWQVIVDASSVINSLIRQGIFCRGGVSVGRLVHEDSALFGPGLIAAYDLESKVAVYPRVLVEKRILGIARQPMLIANIREDFDGFHFIDPFFGLKKHNSSFSDLFQPEWDLGLFTNVRNHIQRKLERFEELEEPGITAKYRWLARWFNIVSEESFGMETSIKVST